MSLLSFTSNSYPTGPRRLQQAGFAAVLLMAALLAGCDTPQANAPGEKKDAPEVVGVVTLASRSIPIVTELPGRTMAYREAQVRARVDGIVLKRAFKEGSQVQKGQLLYLIDPAPYKAALASAQALLAKAKANAVAQKSTAARYQKLLASGTISQQQYDNAVAALGQAEAEIAAGKAAVQKAQIDLSYTRVNAPISGYIGLSQVTEGAYVRASQATLLATIQQLDPIYVDVTQSSDKLLQLRRKLESGQITRNGKEEAAVRLNFSDGTAYGHSGRLSASNITVQPDTGAVRLRAIFPNPEHMLLPGLFVKARIDEGVNPNALVVPQIGVSRNPRGVATVLLVDANNKVVLREIQTNRSVGDNWVVTAGVKPGDRIIVAGLQKVDPGDTVNPQEAASLGTGAANAAGTTTPKRTAD